MKTVFETIWSIVGAMILIWFAATYISLHNADVPQYTTDLYKRGDGKYMPAPTKDHQKQTIEEFLNDHPDIKKRVDELNRQADADMKYKRS